MTVIDKCGQAQKGAWWMSWHREATKDAAACEKLRGAGKRALIRRCLNGETRRSNPPSLLPECIGQVERTRGTETSQYPQEKKETSIPSVAASESGDEPKPVFGPGLRAPRRGYKPVSSQRAWKGPPQRVKVP